MTIRGHRMQSALCFRPLARLTCGLMLAAIIGGCSGTTQSLDRMLGAAPPPTATPMPGKVTTTRLVYYATDDGMKVYAQPSSSSTVVGSLSLNEKVLRSHVERGYALIESTKTEIKGWVDNARLTWKAPGARTNTAPAATGTPVEEPEAVQVEEEEAAHEPTPEPTPTTAPPPAAPTRKPTPEGVGPSIFNPY